MKANYDNNPKKETKVALGSLYEMNKEMMKKEPYMTFAEIDLAITHDLFTFFNQGYHYSMMLCHERRDYTIFHDTEKDPSANEELARLVVECMQNRGRLKSIETLPDGAVELWIECGDGEDEETMECFAYYLFPYDDAIVEV